jgi:hypothetical protein
MGKFSAQPELKWKQMGRFVENTLAKSSQSINKGTFQVNGKSTLKKNL